jgi:hypothetical protein
MDRCRKHIQLAKRFGWDKQNKTELLQAKDMLQLGTMLKKEISFGSMEQVKNKCTLVGCGGSIYWVLTREELERLEKMYTDGQEYVTPTNYGHFVNGVK